MTKTTNKYPGQNISLIVNASWESSLDLTYSMRNSAIIPTKRTSIYLNLLY
jgi:hypothetical protein